MCQECVECTEMGYTACMTALTRLAHKELGNDLTNQIHYVTRSLWTLELHCCV